LIESLRRYHTHYSDEFRVECLVGSGHWRTLGEAALEIADSLTRLFLTNPAGSFVIGKRNGTSRSHPGVI
jgi:hypothetical protein